jgi:hypothetical protein
VSSVQLDHVSVLSTLTRRFELEPLNARTEATSDISAAIDPMLLGAPRQPAALPPVELSLPPDWSMRRLGANYGGQTELWRLGDRGGFPRHLDRRREVDDVARAILEHGQRLGAVKLV